MIRSSFFFPIGLVAMLAFGWLVFPSLLYESESQPLQFSHAAHSEEGAGLSCESCHSFSDDGQFIGVPGVQTCAECHAEPLGETESERMLVEEYVRQDRDIPWKIYARQPDNVYFSHIQHVQAGELTCETCHAGHGTSDSLRVYQVNRISGYSRDIWGHDLSGLDARPGTAMKMTTCSGCHTERGVQESCLACHR